MFSICFLISIGSGDKLRAQMSNVNELIDSTYENLNILKSKVCCLDKCKESPTQPKPCINWPLDPSSPRPQCGDCEIGREIGIYTQDLSIMSFDTTIADAMYNMIHHNSRIQQVKSAVYSEFLNLSAITDSLESQILLGGINITSETKQSFINAVSSRRVFEKDLARLSEVQAEIYKLSSDLFLLSVIQQYGSNR